MKPSMFATALVAGALAFSGTQAQAFTNVASQGIATQSTTAFDGYAGFAIDGNVNGNYGYGAGSVTHTGWETNASWTLALPQAYAVDSINLFNRTDCCADRILGVTLSLFNGNQLAWTSGAITNFTPNIVGDNISGMTFDLPGTVVGDRLVIGRTSVGYLSLAEVQVMAAPVPEAETYAMLMAGLGLLGVIARRRKQGA